MDPNEERALCKQLREQIQSNTKTIPHAVVNGSIQKVAAWREALKVAQKAARDIRATPSKLNSALSNLRLASR